MGTNHIVKGNATAYRERTKMQEEGLMLVYWKQDHPAEDDCHSRNQNISHLFKKLKYHRESVTVNTQNI